MRVELASRLPGPVTNIQFGVEVKSLGAIEDDGSSVAAFAKFMTIDIFQVDGSTFGVFAWTGSLASFVRGFARTGGTASTTTTTWGSWGWSWATVVMAMGLSSHSEENSQDEDVNTDS